MFFGTISGDLWHWVRNIRLLNRLSSYKIYSSWVILWIYRLQQSTKEILSFYLRNEGERVYNDR